MGAGVLCWGWDGSGWVKTLVDSSGHLQVDVLSGVGVASQCYGYDGANWQTLRVGAPSDAFTNPSYALETMAFLMGRDFTDPESWERIYSTSGALHVEEQSPITGFATSAKQDTMITALQLIDDLRNALGSVNTDDLKVDIKDIADGEIKLYGYDGTTWQALRGQVPGSYIGWNQFMLLTGACSMIYDQNSAGYRPQFTAESLGDDNSGQNVPITALMGFDGTYYDRIRVSANMSIMTKEETSNPGSSAPVSSPTLLHNGPAHVYALTVNKANTAVATVQLKNGLDGGSPCLWEARVPGLRPFSKNFWPWLGFSQGLYLDITGDVHSVIVEFGEFS